jgi:O-antigen/teichoic acid export membrane protein
MASAVEHPDPRLSAEPDVLSSAAAGPAAARGAVLRMGSFIAGSLFSVAAAALMFRYLGVIDTGRYTTAMSLGALVTGLSDLGLTGVGLRELSVLRGEQRTLFTRNLLGMRLAFALVGALLITLFAFAAYGPAGCRRSNSHAWSSPPPRSPCWCSSALICSPSWP